MVFNLHVALPQQSVVQSPNDGVLTPSLPHAGMFAVVPFALSQFTMELPCAFAPFELWTYRILSAAHVQPFCSDFWIFEGSAAVPPCAGMCSSRLFYTLASRTP